MNTGFPENKCIEKCKYCRSGDKKAYPDAGPELTEEDIDQITEYLVKFNSEGGSVGLSNL